MSVLALRRIIVSVADLGPALAFYTGALGLAEQYRTDELAMLGMPGGPEVLLHQRPPTPGTAGVAASFVVDDVDAVTAAAEKAGGIVVDSPADQPWGERQSVLTDPDGHVICLVRPIDEAQPDAAGEPDGEGEPDAAGEPDGEGGPDAAGGPDGEGRTSDAAPPAA
jgi:predicted enzyme related to lactoylglutathione lyase